MDGDLLELHSLLFSPPQFLFSVVVLLLIVFLMVLEGGDLFDMLFVVDDLLLQPAHPFLVLLPNDCQFVLQFGDFCLLFLQDGHGFVLVGLVAFLHLPLLFLHLHYQGPQLVHAFVVVELVKLGSQFVDC